MSAGATEAVLDEEDLAARREFKCLRFYVFRNYPVKRLNLYGNVVSLPYFSVLDADFVLNFLKSFSIYDGSVGIIFVIGRTRNVQISRVVPSYVLALCSRILAKIRFVS